MSPSSPVVGQKVTVTATLSEASSGRPVTGQLGLVRHWGHRHRSTSLGTGKTNASGVATLLMTFTAAGMRWVSADFDPGTNPGADPSYRGSTTSAGIGIAPAGLAATPGSARCSSRGARLPEAGGYNVYRNGVRVNSNPLTSAAYLDKGLSNGVVYSYQVTAVVNGRESAKSPAVSATPSARASPMSPPPTPTTRPS